MDVKYIPSDWEKMKDGIGDLIGLGRWGKGMIDELKDLSDILEDAESDIAKYDVDGAIAFQNTSQKSKYQGLFEDFDILHNFSGKVGDIVDRTIDQPFYEDMDVFVQSMRDVSISNYTTTNRIGATEIVQSYAGYGVPQQFEIDKAEVSLDDLLSGDTFYGEQMKLEYEAWKELNPDQDFSQKEYQQAIVNTRAFEYESIRNAQENKEFWFQIGALVVIVGTTLICPPAGIALGAAYGAYELTSALSGKDLVSGRELETSERWVRGLLAPLDIVLGVSGLAKFGSAARLARVGDNLGLVAFRSSVKGSIQQGATAHVHNMVVEAGKSGAARLRSAGTVIQNRANVMVNKAKEGTIEGAKLADKSITGAKNFFQIPQEGLALAGIGPVGRTREVFENTHAVENGIRTVLSRVDGVNLGGGTKDSVKISKEDFDKAVDKAMEEAVTKQTTYNRKPIEPRKYKEKEYNDDGSVTYLLEKNGTEYKVTYDRNGHPVFQPKQEAFLPISKYLAGDREQFSHLSKELYEEAVKNQELKKKFTDEELEIFELGKIPSSLTWHHHQEPGKMQLVDSEIHDAAKHTGGRAYWGGGTDGRKGRIKSEIIRLIKEGFSWEE